MLSMQGDGLCHYSVERQGMSKIGGEKDGRGRWLEIGQERAWWETCGTFARENWR